MLLVVESGKWCGQYSLAFLWASSGNELAGLPPCSRLWACVAGEKRASPASILIAHTFGRCRTERSEPGNVEQNLQTHICWQPLTQVSLPGATLRPGYLVCQTGGETTHRQCGVHQSKMECLCFPGSLTAYFPCFPSPGWGRKRGCNL